MGIRALPSPPISLSYTLISCFLSHICKDKFREPQVWEDVPHVEGALIVNIGDLMERWTNCLYRSTLHRVMSTGKQRYSVAFFFDPPSDCMVECFESCCSESSPPR
ncbi:Isopenicillin N synthase-like [Vigna unguiculata]|uniref:Isopenicillin N synthase-like n=1 Tax=Vigna unguiculata TaxID=3917 RepID=A0A4D6KV76_VIGUN|nr:Isopenicillin N synthase-like [Vigna unguiculata]